MIAKVILLVDQNVGVKKETKALAQDAVYSSHDKVRCTNDGMMAPVKLAASQTQAGFIFTVMEAWDLPRDRCRNPVQAGRSLEYFFQLLNKVVVFAHGVSVIGMA